METNQIIVLAVLAYGAFLGYCLGRAHGYAKGADTVAKMYRS